MNVSVKDRLGGFITALQGGRRRRRGPSTHDKGQEHSTTTTTAVVDTAAAVNVTTEAAVAAGAATAPTTHRLGTARLDSLTGNYTRAGLDPSSTGGATLPLSQPLPNTPLLRYFTTLATAKHMHVSASANSNVHSGDGAFTLRLQFPRVRSFRAPFLPPPFRLVSPPSSSSSSSSPSPSPLQKKASTTATTVDRNRSKANVRRLPAPNRAATVKATGERPMGRRVSVLKIQHDRHVRVEVKRQGGLDSFQFTTDDTEYGAARLQYTPGKRFASSLVLRDTSIVIRNGKPSLTSASSSSSTRRRSHSTRRRSGDGGNSSSSSSDGGGSVGVKPVRSRSGISGVRGSKRRQARRQAKTEVEYVWGEKRWTFLTALEAQRHEVSLRVMTNPLRVTPRIRIPLGGLADKERAPWICWVHEPKTHLGEVEVGWKGISVSNIWAHGALKMAKRNVDGSGMAASLNKRGVVKIDKTFVNEVMKGRFIMTMNGSVGNRKDATSASMQLRGSYGALNAFVKSSKACGASFDVSVPASGKVYHVGFQMDDFKSGSLRLGVFY